jgi:PRC-barrel domain
LVRSDISVLNEGALFARRGSDLRKVRRLIWEANMQTQPHAQATFTMPVKPHRLIASDRAERTPVRRSDGTKVGIIERLMIDKVNGKVAYAVLSFGGFVGIGVKHIPVQWDQMKYGVSLDAYEINLSDAELSRAPPFEADKEFDWGYREDVIGNLNFYRTPPY